MFAKIEFTSNIDLKDKICEFLKSQGWNIEEHTTSKDGDTLHGSILQKDGIKVFLATSGHNSYGKANGNISIMCIIGTLIGRYGEMPETAKTIQGRKYNFKQSYEIGGELVEKYNESGTETNWLGILVISSGTAYINYSEKDEISFIVSARFLVKNEYLWQHLSFGRIIKDADYYGGEYISASRSDWGLMPQANSLGAIDATNNCLLGYARIPSTICYIEIDGAKDYKNELTTRFATAGETKETVHSRIIAGEIDYWAQTHYGTGKTLATSLCDVGSFSKCPKVPSYKNIQSNTCDDYGRVTIYTEAIATVLPIEFYVQRDPAYLENYSHIGTVPSIKATSVRNMGDASIHELADVSDADKKRYMIFPHSLRHGRHGYDGIAVLYDEKDYGAKESDKNV